MIEVICSVCERTFWRHAANVRRTRRPCCSRECTATLTARPGWFSPEGLAKKAAAQREAMRPLLERLLSKCIPEPMSGCWLWEAAINEDGYGTLTVAGKGRKAHAVSHELHKGPLPEGAEHDHLCRTRACINPDHIEGVRPIVNWWRGDAPSARAAKQNHCSRGHEYTPENTTLRAGGGRVCRECARLRNRKYEAKRCAANMPRSDELQLILKTAGVA